MSIANHIMETIEAEEEYTIGISRSNFLELVYLRNSGAFIDILKEEYISPMQPLRVTKEMQDKLLLKLKSAIVAYDAMNPTPVSKRLAIELHSLTKGPDVVREFLDTIGFNVEQVPHSTHLSIFPKDFI